MTRITRSGFEPRRQLVDAARRFGMRTVPRYCSIRDGSRRRVRIARRNACGRHGGRLVIGFFDGTHDSSSLGGQAGRHRAASPRPTAHQRNSVSTFCGAAFACDRIAIPACCRICARVSAAVSLAKSVSWMRERDASTFSAVVRKFAIVDSKRF